jgi:hypothetical protein
MNSSGLHFLLLVLGDENAGLYYFNSSSLSCLRSIEADIHVSETDTFAKTSANAGRDDRREALQYIFYHKVDEELSTLLKEYPVPLFVMGPGTILIRFGRWIKDIKYRVLSNCGQAIKIISPAGRGWV